MTLDLDVLTKLVTIAGGIVALLIAVPNILKGWKEVALLLRAQRRTEYEFAHRLAIETGDLHLKRYAHELGYAALIGDRHLEHGQRQFLLSLPDAELKCVAYKAASDLLTISQNPAGFEWKQRRYALQIYRRVQKLIWFTAYVLAGVLAFSPILAWTFTNPELAMPAKIVAVQVITLIYFLPVSVWCLRISTRIGDAERLIEQRTDKSNEPSKRSAADCC